MLPIPGIGVLKPLFQPNARRPAQGLETGHVQQLAGGTIRTAGIKDQLPAKTRHPAMVSASARMVTS